MKTSESTHFTVKVVPGSSRTCFSGLHDGMVKVRLATPPEKGRANAALVAFLAETLSVKKNTISIVSGHTAPIKHINVEGVDAAYVSECFNTVEPA